MMPKFRCGLRGLHTLARTMLTTSGRWFTCASCRASGIRIKELSRLPCRIIHAGSEPSQEVVDYHAFPVWPGVSTGLCPERHLQPHLTAMTGPAASDRV